MPRRRSWRRRSLRHRIVLLASLGMLATLLTLGALASWTVRMSVERSLQERLLLARVVADRLDSLLNAGLSRLASDSQAWDGHALRGLHHNSVFSGSVFLLDRKGLPLRMEPPRPPEAAAALAASRPVQRALEEVRPVVAEQHSVDPWGRPVVTLVAPVKDADGTLAGLVGGDIDLSRPTLQEVIRTVQVGESGYTDVVDLEGTVLASTHRENVLAGSDHRGFMSRLIRERRSVVGACHSCHEGPPRVREVAAFAPLTAAPWAVVVRQPEAEALAPSRAMEKLFLGFGLFLVGVALAVAWGAAQSVVKPIERLTEAAHTVASGHLDEPLPRLGEDEVGRLGEAFETMREQLRRWTDELESRVRERTRLLEDSEERRKELLRKVISAQEEERQRVARDLHDTTSQELTAMVLALETAAALDDGPLRDRVGEVKTLAVRALEGVHRIMVDLRPAVLDDLGLASALRWYVRTRLEPRGVEVVVEVGGAERRLPPEVETALFRVVQEAINNVARHSGAEVVVLSLAFRRGGVLVEIEDDGRGFDPAELSSPLAGPRGLGLMGMRERVTLLGGTLQLETGPRKGTRITVEVPTDGQDPGAAGG